MVLTGKSPPRSTSVISEIRAVLLIVVMPKCWLSTRPMQQTGMFFMLLGSEKTEPLQSQSHALGVCSTLSVQESGRSGTSIRMANGLRKKLDTKVWSRDEESQSVNPQC